MVKVVMIGAGSVVFAKNLIGDILSHGALADAQLTLVDIDVDRLETARQMGHLIARDLGAKGARIHATTDRRRAIEGADFVISAIGVGGYEATLIDHELPATYGLKQTIGDTLGIGGIFRTLRGAPVLLEIAREMEALCPNALLINYSNPMATHLMVVQQATKIQAVGLCHGVVNTAQTLRLLLGMKDLPESTVWDHFEMHPDDPKRIAQWKEWWSWAHVNDMSYLCAGINHMAFFLRLQKAGKDVYPQLREMLSMDHMLRMDPIRFEVFRYFDYYMTEGSGHTAEYVPWFLKSPEEIKARHIGVSSYLKTCQRQDAGYKAMRQDVLDGKQMVERDYCVSVEYASRIINAVVTGVPYVFNGNLSNQGGSLITNLTRQACVEVPCVADAGGVTPMFVGDLPAQCAALIRTNINVQELVVEGLLTHNKRRVMQAAMVDPNTAAQLTMGQINKLVDEMFAAQEKWIGAW